MDVRVFHLDDLNHIELQDSQTHLRSLFPDQVALGAFSSGYTAVQNDTIMACAGVFERSGYMPILWCLISRHASGHFIAIHRVACRMLEHWKYTELFALADALFSPACRWLEMLGFRLESSEGDRYVSGPDGRNYRLYVRHT